MRKMSGLKRVLPLTRWVMLIGCFALAGFPLFSGFFSKDEIVHATINRSMGLGVVLLITAFLTAYYTFRLYFRVFEGPLVLPSGPAPAHGHGHEAHEDATASQSARDTHTAPASGVDVGQAHHAPDHGDHEHHNHEPASMMLPLIVLAIGALAAGYLNFPRTLLTHFLGHSPSLQMSYLVAKQSGPSVSAEAFGQMEAAHGEATLGAEGDVGTNVWLLMAISAAVSIVAIFFAYLLHLRDRRRAERLAAGLQPITGIVEAKYWIDEIYQALIVEPLRALGNWLWAMDRYIVDGLVNTIAFVPQLGGYFLKFTIQRGYLQGYAAAMLFGVAVILLAVFLHYR